MENYKIVFINGQAFNCDINMSLKDMLIYLDFNINNIIVEYNKEILVNSSFHEIFLQNNDKVEVITIVGGG